MSYGNAVASSLLFNFVKLQKVVSKINMYLSVFIFNLKRCHTYTGCLSIVSLMYYIELTYYQI